jgi:hypothetical protein
MYSAMYLKIEIIKRLSQHSLFVYNLKSACIQFYVTCTTKLGMSITKNTISMFMLHLQICVYLRSGKVNFRTVSVYFVR